MASLVLTGITKRYGNVTALAGVDLDIQPGEVHALLGENGAGKTTLLGVLSGIVTPDAGTIALDEADVRFESPRDALRRGIATVYQHFTVVPNLTVRQNLQLGLSADGFVRDDDLIRRIAETGIALPPDLLIEHLSVAQRQTVEIVKALLHKPTFLLLDEPTSVLSGPEIDRLLDAIRLIASRGTGVVLVTHKLPEALAVADRVTVLRAGHVAGQTDLRAIPALERSRITYQLVQLMFGERAHPESHLPGGVAPTERPAHSLLSATTPEQGEIVARLTGVTAHDDRGHMVLNGLSLVLARGDVVGIAGVDGNGQDELVEVLSGERGIESGSLEIGGEGMTNAGVRALIAAGVGVTTAERLAIGCVPGMSLALNLVLKHLAEPPFATGMRLDRSAIRQFGRDVIRDYEIRPDDPDRPITHLSGGNIQRALLARELAFGPRVLVCHQPTAGLDAATAEQMLRHIRDAAQTGAGVILISSDLDELLATCDRIAVLYRGRIVRVLARPDFNSDRIGRMMVTGQDHAA